MGGYLNRTIYNKERSVCLIVVNSLWNKNNYVQVDILQTDDMPLWKVATYINVFHPTMTRVCDTVLNEYELINN